MKPYLETTRLILRPFAVSDAEDLFALDADQEVMRYIGPYQLADIEAYRERIRTVNIPYYALHPGFGVWLAAEKAGGAFLGWFILRRAIDCRFAAEVGFRADEVELGYRLRKAAWGKGYATEGSRALVHKAFTELDAASVVATALAGNLASLRVMEKVGLRPVGEYRIPGYDMPSVKCALSREQYLQGVGDAESPKRAD